MVWVVLVGLIGVLAWLLWQDRCDRHRVCQAQEHVLRHVDYARRELQAVRDLIASLSVTKPSPPPVGPTVAPPLMPSDREVLIRFMSGSERRLLGEMIAPKRARQGTYSFRGSDGLLGQFQASRQESTGTWIYRRVGVETDAAR